MSNFTYEIDERNLRLKMKEFTVPFKEDAWQKFETFSDTMVSQHRENGLTRFNFTLNRNVVLPSVFGIIIILFSFLLVNFVSIKNPAKESKVELKPAPLPEPKPMPPAEKPMPATAAKSKPVVQPVSEPTVAEAIQTEEQAIVTVSITEPKPEAVPAQNTVSTEASTDIAVEEAKAKRRAERRAARAAEMEKLNEIKPTPVVDEGPAEEVRPD